MKAIILAAGEGKRLRPLTNDKPKCMVELFDKSILEKQISTLRSCGISEIIVVTGYKSEMINLPDLKYIKNQKYNQTNMVETLFCAKRELKDSVIVSYGDIIYEKKVLEKIIDSTDDISAIVDEEWERYWRIRSDSPLDDAETLELDDDFYIKEIGQKTEDLEKIQGQYIGLMKFQGSGLEDLIIFYEKSKNAAKNGINPLNSNLSFEKSYMTDLLQGMIKEGFSIKAIPISNGWLEIDTVSDYQTYTKLYNQGELGNFYRTE
jgi:choline kinase